jgi:hypothetical protein
VDDNAHSSAGRCEHLRPLRNDNMNLILSLQFYPTTELTTLVGPWPIIQQPETSNQKREARMLS